MAPAPAPAGGSLVDPQVAVDPRVPVDPRATIPSVWAGRCGRTGRWCPTAAVRSQKPIASGRVATQGHRTGRRLGQPPHSCQNRCPTDNASRDTRPRKHPRRPRIRRVSQERSQARPGMSLSAHPRDRSLVDGSTFRPLGTGVEDAHARLCQRCASRRHDRPGSPVAQHNRWDAWQPSNVGRLTAPTRVR